MQRRFMLSLFRLVAIAFLVLVASFSTRAHGQTPVFGNVNLCPAGQNTPAPCSLTQLITVNVTASGTIATTKVVTAGVANLDFTYEDGGSCTGAVTAGSTCTVNVKFSPILANARLGAVQLLDSGNIVLGTTYIRGAGVGPQVGYSVNGGELIQAGSPNIKGVASDSAGSFYWSNFDSSSVVELPANGGPQVTLASGLNNPLALAVDGAGNVIVNTSSGMMKIPAGGGTPITFGDRLLFAESIAIDGAGNVYIVNNAYGQQRQVMEIPAGGGSPTVVPGDFNSPSVVAADADGNLFVEDLGGGKLYKLPADGSPQVLLASAYLFELGVDGAGNLYAGDATNMTIYPALGGNPLPLNIYSTYQTAGGDFAIDPGGNILALPGYGTNVLKIQRSGPPPSLAFATTNDGSTSSDSPKSVEVINSGNRPLTVSALSVSADFAQQSTSGAFADCGSSFALQPGESCNISISFAPADGGMILGSVALTDNTGNNASVTQSIGLSGTGLVLQPTTTTLFTNSVHTIYSQPVTLTATVTAPVGIPVGTVTFANGSTVLGTATLDGTGAATISTAAIPVGANALTASYAAAVNFLSSVSSPVTVTVNSDEATAGAANVCPLGKTSPAPCSKTVTVTYLAATATTLGTPIVVTQGIRNLDFALASTTCNGAIAAGATCTVTVKFTPKFPGMRAGGVQIVDSTGTVLATFNIQGSGTAPQIAFGSGAAFAISQGDYTVDTQGGLVVDTAGNAYVSNSDGSGIVRYAAGTGVQSHVDGAYGAPMVIGIDGAGSLYFFEQYSANIVEIPAGGGASFTVANGLTQATAFTVDAAGSIYIAAATQILKIAGDTKVQTVVVDGLTNYLSGLAVDAAGNIFASQYAYNSGGILKIPVGCSDSACQVLVPTQHPYPTQSIAVDPAGNVYFTYQYLTTIYELPADGSAERPMASDPLQSGYIGPIALDSAGSLYLLDIAYGDLFRLPRSQPPALQFTTTNTNTVSTDSPQSIAVQNIGNAALKFAGLKVSSGFLQAAGSGTPVDCAAGGTLLAGTSCNLSISFSPKTGGPITGSAIFTDNSLNLSGSTQTVALAGTGFVQQKQTITFLGIPSQTIGSSVALSAVSSSGLAVSLTSTSPDICTVSGTTATVSAAGTCSIQATQGGNDTYLPANPVVRSFAVKLKSQQIAFASIPSQFVGTPVALSATSTSGLAVVFTSATPTVCTISGTTATSVAAGTCTIHADQPGGGAYAAAPTVTRSFAYKLQTQTITFASIPAQTIGAPLTLVATSSSGLTVSFASATPAICTVTGTTASFVTPGTCSLQALQAGNQTYAAAPVVTRSFAVKLATQTIAFSAIPPQISGTSSTLSATASSGLAVSFSSATTSVCTVADTTVTMLIKGSCKIVASQPGNATYSATSLTQTFTVY